MKHKLFLCCTDRCRKYEIRILLENPQARHIRTDVVVFDDTETLFTVGINWSPESLIGMVVSSWEECPHHHASEEVLMRLNYAVQTEEERKRVAHNCGADSPIGPQSDDHNQRFFSPK